MCACILLLKPVCAFSGMRTERLSEEQIQQVLQSSRAATYAEAMSCLFKLTGNAGLVAAVHTQAAELESSLKVGTMTEEIWSAISSFVESLRVALDAASKARGDAHIRDLILDGESEDSDCASSSEEEDVGEDMNLMYGSSKENFILLLLPSFTKLRVCTSPAYIASALS